MLPFLGIFLGSELKLFVLDSTTLVVLAGALAVIDVGAFFVAKATFQREEILSRWR